LTESSSAAIVEYQVPPFVEVLKHIDRLDSIKSFSILSDMVEFRIQNFRILQPLHRGIAVRVGSTIGECYMIPLFLRVIATMFDLPSFILTLYENQVSCFVHNVL